MQRDMKIGIAIGVLLLALVAIFWWAHRESKKTAPPPPVSEAPEPELPTMPPSAPASGSAEVPWPAPEAAGASATAPTATPPAGGAAVAPTPAAQPIAPPPAPVARTHTIKQGDTLQGISNQYYGTVSKWRVILDANRDKNLNPNSLKVGTVITIPDISGAPVAAPTPGPAAPAAAPAPAGETRKHTVKKDETLSSISRQYYGSDAKWRKIFDANRDKLRNPNDIKIGMVLSIPPEN